MNMKNENKKIENGIYIVTGKLSTCNSGSIIRVINRIVIDRDDFLKDLYINDIERDKLDKIEENESNYLLKYKIDERMEKHKNKIFNKIKELNIGDECYYKNDWDNIYIVKQKNIDDKGVRFVLQMKNLLNKREINVEAFDIVLIEKIINIPNKKEENNQSNLQNFEKEKLHFICDKIVDINKINFVSLLDNSHENDHLIGSTAMTVVTFPDGNKQELIGEIKWIGKINNEKCVGLDMEDKFGCGINGEIYDYHKFDCLEGHGMITLLNNIELLRNIDESHFCRNGIINPDKYLVCKEKIEIEFLNSRNVKLNEFVFVLLKYSNGERKKKGILRWCGRMNELSVCVVELNEEHELGTNGRFWRTQLIKCGNKRAIAVLSINIYQYEPYESMIIPVDDRLFGDIDINSYVQISDECDEVFKGLCGTVRWSGKDENNQYLYGIELENKFSFGSNGQFNGQKLFHCQNGFGALVSAMLVTTVITDINIINQNFSRFYFASNDVDLKYETMKKLMKMKDKSILKSIISCPENPIELDIHHDLLQILINESDFEIIRLLLRNCTNYNSYNDVFLNLSNIALFKDDDELFGLSVEKCTNKNAMLENGETFLTNLFKKNCDENIINKIIDKKIFDTNLTNKNNELPLILACERVMVSTIEKIVNNKPLYTYHKNLALKMIAEAENKLSQMNRSIGDIFKIIRLLSNVPTNNSMECSICFDNDVSLVFQCGHLSCDKCIEKLFKCPFCDQEIKNPIRIYLN